MVILKITNGGDHQECVQQDSANEHRIQEGDGQMSYKLSPTICEFCGLHRKHHNEIQKKKCSNARKAAHENDKLPRKNKRVFYESSINYLVNIK